VRPGGAIFIEPQGERYRIGRLNAARPTASG
jgi:hypothetical protein